jgi:MEDS: MEthanogen/methylotroph, DcmR Sensory domain
MRVLDEVSFEAAEAAPRTPASGDHCVTLVEDYEDAATVACPFIAEGLRAGERVLSWLPREVCARIEQTLTAEELGRLQLVDSADVYKAPFDAAAMVDRVREISRSEPTPLRIVGGPMGDPAEVAPAEEWERYESLAHELAFSEGITALCVWERPTMPDDVLEMVRRSHALMHREDAMRRNPDFVWAG